MKTLTAGSVKQFKEFSKFKSLKSFNSTIEQVLLDSPFTKSELVAFKRLVRYSAKYPGVCYAKIQTLVSATHKETLGISRSTFERMLTKAKKAGILIVKNTMKNNRKGHNVYVFTPYKQIKVVSKSNTNDVLESEKVEALNKADSPIKTNKPNTYKERKEEPSPMIDSEYVSSNISKDFIEAVKPFYNDANTIVALYKRLSIAVSKTGQTSLILTHMNDFIKVFKESIYKYKHGKIRKSLFGYIYRAWEKTASLLIMQQSVKNSDFANWFNNKNCNINEDQDLFASLMN